MIYKGLTIFCGGKHMDYTNFSDFTTESVPKFIMDSVDAVLVVDSENDQYKKVISKGFLKDYLPDSGSYHDLIEDLWYHFADSGEKITEDYHVFIPSFGKFSGKYAKRIKIKLEDVVHNVEMTVYPAGNTGIYVFALNELDDSESEDEVSTKNKVTTIQNTYLFSMYVDLIKDTTSSISITEISDETVNTQIKYSDWRMMIVNMIWPEDQPLFLERTDPEYMKANYAPGKTSSFDCLMQNLEGNYIWVKLIFSRAETSNEGDFRFVFMVQDIHENTVSLMSTLKKYEEMASLDPLTGIWNHGRIETEITNALEAIRNEPGDTALMMMDIDYFKRVNDEYGHSAGDMTLKQFAEAISDFLKEKNGFVGRWGGEEFVAVCYNSGIDTQKDMAEELRRMISAVPFKAVGTITCSIGVTPLLPEDDLNTAFERVDKAMYQAKSGGRNMVVVNMPG